LPSSLDRPAGLVQRSSTSFCHKAGRLSESTARLPAGGPGSIPSRPTLRTQAISSAYRIRFAATMALSEQSSTMLQSSWSKRFQRQPWTNGIAQWPRMCGRHMFSSLNCTRRLAPAVGPSSTLHRFTRWPHRPGWRHTSPARERWCRLHAQWPWSFAPFGIRANAVLPGAIDTPMLAAGLKRSRSTSRVLASRHPLGRLGKPQDVAEAVGFLADSSRSGFITGQTLIVDGGATARLNTE
jgi:NAD(P)-dependent dehydrogenase (short-subunit alcohol dehydrogenase family)